jgi:pentatricopeptide repeat protein
LAFLDLLPSELADSRTFNMVVSVCAGAWSIHGAFKVLGQLRERGLKPDLKFYTNMITVSAR